MTGTLDFQEAARFVRVTPTTEQELAMLEHRFASHGEVARLTGLPVGAVQTIRNRLGIDARTSRRLAGAEQAHDAFGMFLRGESATTIGEARGVSRGVVYKEVAGFFRRVLRVRGEASSSPDWAALRADPEPWLSAAGVVLEQMRAKRKAINDALEERRQRRADGEVVP